MSVVTDTYTYTAFGETKASTGTTTNVYTWVGELGYFRDAETGSYNLRERPYEPDKARFKSEDPIGLTVDSNLYRYVRNNPTCAVDPGGLVAVVIHADAFIPDAWIWIGGPFIQLKGDNRSTMLKPPAMSQSRVTSYIKIETNELLSKDPLLGHTHLVSPSTRSFFGIQQTALGTANGSETATRTGSRSVRVKIKVSAYIPQVLVPGAPHIDYRYTVNVFEDCNGVVHYSVSGAHDGFPAYELFVGGQLAHRSTPADIGGVNNPFALFGESDYAVEEAGTLPGDSGPPQLRSRSQINDRTGIGGFGWFVQ
jgi:RHS repeat-associated protein